MHFNVVVGMPARNFCPLVGDKVQVDFGNGVAPENGKLSATIWLFSQIMLCAENTVADVDSLIPEEQYAYTLQVLPD